MSNELLANDIADNEARPMWHQGEEAKALTDEIDKYLGPAILGEGNHVQIYREFKPMKDSWEFTLYFKIKGYKMRSDFEVEHAKFETMDQAELYRECLLSILDGILWVAETHEIKINFLPAAMKS